MLDVSTSTSRMCWPKICGTTLAELADRKSRISLDEVRHAAAAAGPTRGFGQKLKERAAEGRFGLIAEIKRASPSGGLIRPDCDPVELARAYQRGGATCLSVLTEFAHFQGSAADLKMAREVVDLPVLRKDFVLDPWQVYESRAMGADCILLIIAALSDQQARDLAGLTRALDMDVLVEVHDRRELERALGLETSLIGINNRNLKTLVTDLTITEELAAMVPRRPLPDRRKRHSHVRGRPASRRGRADLLPGGREPAAPRRCGSGDPGADRRVTAGQPPAGGGPDRDFSHFDTRGQAAMVDVSGKAVTARTATARGRVVMLPETLALIRSGGSKKGDVLGVARIAGIMAAKRTAELIPLLSSAALVLGVAGADGGAGGGWRGDYGDGRHHWPDRGGDGGADRGLGGGPDGL